MLQKLHLSLSLHLHLTPILRRRPRRARRRSTILTLNTLAVTLALALALLPTLVLSLNAASFYTTKGTSIYTTPSPKRIRLYIPRPKRQSLKMRDEQAQDLLVFQVITAYELGT